MLTKEQIKDRLLELFEGALTDEEDSIDVYELKAEMLRGYFEEEGEIVEASEGESPEFSEWEWHQKPKSEAFIVPEDQQWECRAKDSPYADPHQVDEVSYLSGCEYRRVPMKVKSRGPEWE